MKIIAASLIPLERFNSMISQRKSSFFSDTSFRSFLVFVVKIGKNICHVPLLLEVKARVLANRLFHQSDGMFSHSRKDSNSMRDKKLDQIRRT